MNGERTPRLRRTIVETIQIIESVQYDQLLAGLKHLPDALTKPPVSAPSWRFFVMGMFGLSSTVHISLVAMSNAIQASVAQA